MKFVILLVLIVSSLLIVELARADDPDPSLYQRLGGEPVVRRVVGETMRRVTDDPDVRRAFERVDVRRLDARIAARICVLAGGGCRTTEVATRSAARSPADAPVGRREADALFDAMRGSLDANGVGARERDELLRLLAPIKRDLVTG